MLNCSIKFVLFSDCTKSFYYEFGVLGNMRILQKGGVTLGGLLPNGLYMLISEYLAYFCISACVIKPFNQKNHSSLDIQT